VRELLRACTSKYIAVETLRREPAGINVPTHRA